MSCPLAESTCAAITRAGWYDAVMSTVSWLLVPLAALPLATTPPAQASQREARVPADSLPARLEATSPMGLPELPPGDDSPQRVALGRRLFFDPLLSKDRSVACATCHDPARAFTDGEPRSEGVGGALTLRNTPSLLNRVYGSAFMWDGLATTLEEQVLLPIENELEMNLSHAEALERLAAEASYRSAFEGARLPLDRAGLASALSAFVRRLTMGDSPVDRFRAGDRGALNAAERAGLWFYESRGQCWRCHSGGNFTDEGFHNTGVGVEDDTPREGRFAITGVEQDRGRFKTPTLRGVARTAPYMHDGSLATLEEVVAFYRRGGNPNRHLDAALTPIEMTDTDASNLVAFLEALSRESEGARPPAPASPAGEDEHGVKRPAR